MIKNEQVNITVRFNLKELETALESIDFMIRKLQDGKDGDDFGRDFKNCLFQLSRDMSRIYGQAIEFKAMKDKENERHNTVSGPR